MSWFNVLLVISCVTAGTLAAAIFARDPSERSNRLLAAMLACSAYWSLCEIVWDFSNDPETVVMLVRWSCIGWILLGPLTLDLFVEVTGSARSPYRRFVPVAYATAAIAIALYISTPLFVHTPVRISDGWSFAFGPLFPLAFVPTIFFVCVSLVVWPGLITSDISRGEKRQILWMFFGILIPTAVATTTDVILPSQGIPFPRLGSTSILLVGVAVAWSIRRHGTFLLSPGAFTAEILDTLRDGVAFLSAGGHIRSCNEALAQLIGASQEDLRERPIAEILPGFGFDPEVERVDFETGLVPEGSASGRTFPVSVSSSPLRDDKAETIGCVIAVRDLREVETLRSRLVTSGRFAAVGELAAGIAHEINNPITFVRANLITLRKEWDRLAEVADIVHERVDLDSRFRESEEILEESVEGVDRIATIVRDVGAISHAGIDRFEPVALNELLDNAVNVAALSFSVSIERCYSDLPPIRCAPQQIKQVFLNLLINAFQAIGDLGSIELVTRLSGDHVEIRIKDDGCGIETDDIDRIFDPFFTTRPVGEGTGLGLALCYQIIRNHGGDIRVESEVGVGTTVLVRLPLDPVPAASAESRAVV